MEQSESASNNGPTGGSQSQRPARSQEVFSRSSNTLPILLDRPATAASAPSEAPPEVTSPFLNLPDEIQIDILTYVLAVHRITPRISRQLGDVYAPHGLSLVCKQMHNLVGEIYYGTNIVSVKSIKFRRYQNPDTSNSLANFDSHFDMICVSSITVSPWIKHLEITINVTGDATLESQLQSDLGALMHLKKRTSARTFWQGRLTKLRTLKIVFTIEHVWIESSQSRQISLPAFKDWLEIDLRPQRVHVATGWTYGRSCCCRRLEKESCDELIEGFKDAIRSMVKFMES
jgi:hypothetical protein